MNVPITYLGRRESEKCRRSKEGQRRYEKSERKMRIGEGGVVVLEGKGEWRKGREDGGEAVRWKRGTRI